MRRHPQSSAPCFRSSIARSVAFPNRFSPGFCREFQAVGRRFGAVCRAGTRRVEPPVRPRRHGAGRSARDGHAHRTASRRSRDQGARPDRLAVREVAERGRAVRAARPARQAGPIRHRIDSLAHRRFPAGHPAPDGQARGLQRARRRQGSDRSYRSRAQGRRQHGHAGSVRLDELVESASRPHRVRDRGGAEELPPGRGRSGFRPRSS